VSADLSALAGTARRVFIIGPSGSGKSTLANRLAESLAVPVHDLDLVFREGGGNGPARPSEPVTAEIEAIAATPAWIAEGLHLDGTEPLLESADLIVWLDDGSWAGNSARIVRRFFSGAWSTARSQRRFRDFFRFGDYWRHLRELGSAVPKARRYEAGGGGSTDESDEPTHQDVARALAPYESKVVRCSSNEETRQLVSQLRPAAARHG